MLDSNIFIFVYGTLRKERKAHYYLTNSDFIGKAKTSNKYTLYASVNYPAMVHQESENGIEGEIYRVTAATKLALDQYEGVDYGLFRCVLIDLESVDSVTEFKDVENKIASKVYPVYAYLYCGDLENFEKVKYWT